MKLPEHSQLTVVFEDSLSLALRRRVLASLTALAFTTGQVLHLQDVASNGLRRRVLQTDLLFFRHSTPVGSVNLMI